MYIFVDADACPVVDIIVDEAKKYTIQVKLVRSYSHYSHQDYPSHVSISYVDNGADAVDYHIMGQAQRNDIVVTQDYGLAALALEKGCNVLHHAGFLYTEQKIDRMLQERHVKAKARKAGFRTKGPKKLTDKQKESFRLQLRKLLSI
ncbi:YaiI/YqxD family protein [Gracilibacillus sp. YIM 98692]|uniref:YaiI/YqxD family protein n=1 Tax=Gracilibacillus sp. YIM 98692 TaxID=2663532 RepID=UPI0013D8305D|nr:YaiI/YqxD family protein [Gracilibacillus sp. YIM 98692]